MGDDLRLADGQEVVEMTRSRCGGKLPPAPSPGDGPHWCRECWRYWWSRPDVVAIIGERRAKELEDGNA